MKKESKKIKNGVVMYQAKSGAIELRGDFTRETVWATQAQIAEVFGVKRPAITKHIANILKDKELDIRAVCSKMEHTAEDGKTYIVQYYSLDIILAVGYRVNSSRAIEFRQWATKTLRTYITQGYVLNRKIILKNYDQFIKTVGDIQALLPEHVILDPKAILDLVKEYSTTWTKLDAYDRDALSMSGVTKKKIKLAGAELLAVIAGLKNDLLSNGEATDIFAHERFEGSIEGIVGNVMQSFGGQEVYGTLEEKAAHLLYFMVKNHPFTDGNKRSGAFAFIWFLKRYGVKGARNINPTGLTAITLLIAESAAQHKDKMVALVVELLRINKK